MSNTRRISANSILSSSNNNNNKPDFSSFNPNTNLNINTHHNTHVFNNPLLNGNVYSHLTAPNNNNSGFTGSSISGSTSPMNNNNNNSIPKRHARGLSTGAVYNNNQIQNLGLSISPLNINTLMPSTNNFNHDIKNKNHHSNLLPNIQIQSIAPNSKDKKELIRSQSHLHSSANLISPPNISILSPSSTQSNNSSIHISSNSNNNINVNSKDSTLIEEIELKKQIDHALRLYGDLPSSTDNLDDAIGILNRELASQESKRVEAEERVHELNSNMTQLQQELTKKESLLQASNNKKEELNSQVKKLSFNIAAKEEVRRKSVKEITELTIKLNDTQDKVESSRQVHQQVVDQTVTLEKSVNDLKHRLEGSLTQEARDDAAQVALQTASYFRR